LNQAFRDLFGAKVAGAVASAKALGQVDHSGLKGALREVLVRSLLRPFLPPSIGVGHGIVISAYDDQSTEQDVVIYNRANLPCILIDEESGLFPLESTLFTIEVKSKLNATELEKTHEKAARLEKLRHTPGETTPEHVIPCLFAFETDLVQKTDLQRYQQLIGTSDPSIREICVVGHGRWFWTPQGWHHTPPTDTYSEVAGLIDGISSVYERVQATRSRPLLLNYVD
jgi:hypothetical protein